MRLKFYYKYFSNGTNCLTDPITVNQIFFELLPCQECRVSHLDQSIKAGFLKTLNEKMDNKNPT